MAEKTKKIRLAQASLIQLQIAIETQMQSNFRYLEDNADRYSSDKGCVWVRLENKALLKILRRVHEALLKMMFAKAGMGELRLTQLEVDVLLSNVQDQETISLLQPHASLEYLAG